MNELRPSAARESERLGQERVALVTGALSGIGLATALMLARNGFRVFGTSRTPQAHRPVEVELLRLDPSNPSSVEACIQAILARAGNIDVLVNNIGGGIAGAVEEVSISEAQAVFDANLWSAFRVTQAVLPTMREQGHGHIIGMSSMAGLIGLPYRGVYNASKFALESIFEALRHELDPLNIRVSLVKPSGVATTAADRVPRAVRSLQDYQPAAQNLGARFDAAMRNGMPPDKVARTILRIVNTPTPRLRYPVGVQVRLLGAMQRLVPERLLIPAMGRIFARLGRRPV